MNFSPIQNVLSTTLTYFEDQMIKPLTNQQQKVALIALAIFSALAASFVIYRRCFRVEKIDSDSDDSKIPTPNKQETKKTPEKKNTVETKKTPEKKDSVETKKSPEKKDSVETKKSPEKKDETDPIDDKKVDPEFEKAKEEITKNGLALEHYPQYHKYPSLVELAIKQSKGFALQFTQFFQDDDKMVELAIDGNPYAVQFASDRYRGSYTKMAPLVEKHGFLVQYATDELRTNSRSLAKLSVESDGMTLEFLEAFNDDDEIVDIAISNNKKAIKFASERIQKLKAELKETKELEDETKEVEDEIKEIEDETKEIEDETKEIEDETKEIEDETKELEEAIV